MPTFLNTVNFQISLDFLRPMSEALCREKTSICFGEAPLIRGNKRNTDQWASTKHHMEGFSRHNFFAHWSQKSSKIGKMTVFQKWA